ncbi:MAG TPA: ATP-dependent protease ATPase subunit HslU [Clostridiales bacterium]|jgi:ATP-dependent HslUV protease ATP-binding subunit HslU|nr:ATP-dependent protease ATPase subunit HslU [Clostridiales bacterium]
MLTPKEIVAQLDKYIIGQNNAKRAVAIALRNRYRRSLLSPEMQEEVYPKNIIMMGPTGVGKTEIARRLAKLVDAPFVKVEATKFTEVGYVGRDVDSMIRDLIDVSVRMTKTLKAQEVQRIAESAAENRILDLLMGTEEDNSDKDSDAFAPIQMLFGGMTTKKASQADTYDDISEEETLAERERLLHELREGRLDDALIEVVLDDNSTNVNDAFFAMGIDINMGDLFSGILPKKKKKRKIKVSEAYRIFVQEEIDKLIDMDEVIREAIKKAEQEGIVFIDEIDKIATTSRSSSGPDVSREGVQRDILPIVEGSAVSTKYGIVKTDHILFIAAGAFHMTKVADLIPELQGRFPIRVQLEALTKDDFVRILTQPQNAIIKQYKALLATDNIEIEFTDDAIDRIAKYAYDFNENCENIGARRLHTIIENLLDEISFETGGKKPKKVLIDAKYVDEHISKDIAVDLRKYII